MPRPISPPPPRAKINKREFLKPEKNTVKAKRTLVLKVKHPRRRAPRSRALRPLLAQIERNVGPLSGEIRTLVEAYCEVAIRGAVTFARKQKDYGPGNIAGGGALGVLIRLRDKVERQLNLAGQEALNESKADTAEDAHVYGGILSLVLAGLWPRMTKNPRLAL